MNKRLKAWMRIVMVISSLAIAGAIVLPIWRIELSAPQYPEGLVMQIYASKLGGDVNIVNGLNHYIGMRTLHEKDFIEFTYLPYVLGFFALFGLLTAAIGRRSWLYTFFGSYALFAVVAMVDFWHWEHNYGHNLDPTAPIQVPGMSYQPPLIGFKQLLNFGAYSIPDKGGWLMAVAAVLLALCTILAWRAARPGVAKAAAVLAILVGLSSCNSGPVPIKVGTDNCDFCKMTVADARFGAEVVSKKGKAWKFDDAHCLVSFLKEGSLKNEDLHEVYFVRFDGAHEFLPSTSALLLQAEPIHSPMGSNIAAFADKAGLDGTRHQMNGKQISWSELKP